MPLTSLDPRTALIVIDLQRGIAARPLFRPVAEVVERANDLIAAFRRNRSPIVLVNVDGVPPGRTEQASNVAGLPEWWTKLLPELNAEAGDHRVTKRNWGAFTDTDLDAYLKAAGITQVVVVGIATSLGVESTARHARELRFNVALAVDAMSDGSREAHDNSVGRIFPRLGETCTTADVIAMLDGR